MGTIKGLAGSVDRQEIACFLAPSAWVEMDVKEEYSPAYWRVFFAYRKYPVRRLGQSRLELRDLNAITGEGLALLVDLHPTTDRAYLCRVTDATVCAFSSSDHDHSQLVQFGKWLVHFANDHLKTPFYPLKHG